MSGRLAEAAAQRHLDRMSVEAVYIMRNRAPRSGLKDLDRVELTASVVSDDGDTIAAGSRGTVVGVWHDGAAYEVEFTHPVAGLATVDPAGLRLADDTV